MIEVKVRDIVNSFEEIKKLITIPLPSRAAYQVARLAREVEKEYNLFIEARNKIITKYGKKDENGELVVNKEDQWTIENEFVNDCEKDLNELLDVQVELNVNKIKLDDLNVPISAGEMMALMVFVEE